MTKPAAAPTVLEALAKTGKHEILLAAVKAAGLDKTLQAAGTVALLAPTDQAFRDLAADRWDVISDPRHVQELTRLLQIHVVPGVSSLTSLASATSVKTVEGRELPVVIHGQDITVGGSKVATNQRCSNGVLLETDRVVLSAVGDLMAVMDTRGYTTMASLIRTAGMQDALGGTMPYTVFVPSDEAFAKLPAGALDRLRKQENAAELKAFINHHVVRGRCSLASLLAGKAVRLNDGAQVAVTITGASAKVGDATISMPDDDATNGCLHRIDTVLTPVK